MGNKKLFILKIDLQKFSKIIIVIRFHEFFDSLRLFSLINDLIGMKRVL
jgi:hypothetical protein